MFLDILCLWFGVLFVSLSSCSDSEVLRMEGLAFVILGATEYEFGDNIYSSTKQSISSDSGFPYTI